MKLCLALSAVSDLMILN